MTVSELIAELQKYPGETQVGKWDHEHGQLNFNLDFVAVVADSNPAVRVVSLTDRAKFGLNDESEVLCL